LSDNLKFIKHSNKCQFFNEISLMFSIMGTALRDCSVAYARRDISGIQLRISVFGSLITPLQNIHKNAKLREVDPRSFNISQSQLDLFLHVRQLGSPGGVLH
jgi:hypothetical protein